jgi:hypothetical protein
MFGRQLFDDSRSLSFVLADRDPSHFSRGVCDDAHADAPTSAKERAGEEYSLKLAKPVQVSRCLDACGCSDCPMEEG